MVLVRLVSRRRLLEVVVVDRPARRHRRGRRGRRWIRHRHDQHSDSEGTGRAGVSVSERRRAREGRQFVNLLIRARALLNTSCTSAGPVQLMLLLRLRLPHHGKSG